MQIRLEQILICRYKRKMAAIQPHKYKIIVISGPIQSMFGGKGASWRAGVGTSTVTVTSVNGVSAAFIITVKEAAKPPKPPVPSQPGVSSLEYQQQKNCNCK